jgi:hypothetical protein
MSDNKIRISADEVSRVADASPPLPSAPFDRTINSTSPLSKGFSPLFLGVVLTIGIFIMILISTVVFSSHRESLEAWIQHERNAIDANLSMSSQAKEMIESIHPLVTFTSANVKSIRATTVDGTDNPGRDGSNVSELEFIVTYHWEGPVEKNGFTEVLYLLDVQANKLKGTRYLASNAVVNLNNVDWVTLGFELAPLLFGGN